MYFLNIIGVKNVIILKNSKKLKKQQLMIENMVNINLAKF